MIEAVRSADHDDLVDLCDLAAIAVREQVDARGGYVWSQREAIEIPAEPVFVRALYDPAALLLVGTIDSTVVGYTRAHHESLRNGELLGVINDIFVIEGAREVGVGELLIEAVVAWAIENGCSGVDAIVLPGNRQSKNFFETAHFTARAIIVHHRLPMAGEDVP
ncbi:MAG: N-acetyltransferase family protein [Acidimicrobiales bacterium]